jgi:acyl carrier protein
MSTGNPTPPTQWNDALVGERVVSIVREKTPHPVSLDSTFESVGLDSLAMAEIVFEIESEFKINADDRLLDLKSLREVSEYILRALQRRATSASNQ